MTVEQEVQRQFQQFRSYIGGTLQGYVDTLYGSLKTDLANFRQAALNRFTTLQTNQQSIVDSLSILHTKVDALNTKVDDFTAQYATDRQWGKDKVLEIQDELTALAAQLSDVEGDIDTLKTGGQQIGQSLTAHRAAMES